MTRLTARADIERLPYWAEDVLQGIAFWIGHRRTYYRYHPLTEGAITAELCNLLNAKLRNGEQLTCEVMYRKLIKKTGTKWGDERVDLLIEQSRNCVSSKDGDHNPVAVIEVTAWLIWMGWVR